MTDYWFSPDGRLHRESGPAIVWPDGRKEWWCDGKRHRVDGPAIVCPNGRVRWYLDDVELDLAWAAQCISTLPPELVVAMAVYEVHES